MHLLIQVSEVVLRFLLVQLGQELLLFGLTGREETLHKALHAVAGEPLQHVVQIQVNFHVWYLTKGSIHQSAQHLHPLEIRHLLGVGVLLLECPELASEVFL